MREHGHCVCDRRRQLITPKQTSTFKELQAKVGPEGNYKVYRQTEFESKPPMIPFFGPASQRRWRWQEGGGGARGVF